MQYVRCLLFIVCCLSISGCHYYQDYRQKQGEADVTKEKAELMKAYRECVTKYEDDPAVIRERCGAYNDMLRKMDIGPNQR